VHGGLEVQHTRGEGTPPLIARFGGLALRWHRHGILNEKPKEVDGHRSAVVPRLLAQTCARCGAQEQCAVHHIRRRADLHKPGRKEKPLWVQRRGAYRRKTLVTCRACHETLHRERPGRRHVPIEVTGKLLEIERLTSSLEGGRWKRAARHLAGGLPYRKHGFEAEREG
jgi:AI2M/AI1M-like, HNH endonuclease